MKKICLCMCVLSCLFLGCTNETAKKSHSSSDTLTAAMSEMLFILDSPGKMKLTYKSENNDVEGVGLKVVEANSCVEFITDPLVTDPNGIAYLEMKIKQNDCDDKKSIKVCVDQNEETEQKGEICTEFTFRFFSEEDMVDENNNLMIDAFETNTDKDKYTEEMYTPGDCSSYCHDDSDCEDFCDSAIGYRCSTRCTSDDQCIKYKDEAGNWNSMKCRKDGRCAYPSFKAVYNIKHDNSTLKMNGQPDEENVTIDWGDGTKEIIPMTTHNNLSHTYQQKGKYTVEIVGEYSNWTAGCTWANKKENVDKTIQLIDIEQFGSIGLGFVGTHEVAGDGCFWNCYDLKKISAKDIPDASKLIEMTQMFGGEHSDSTNYVMKFNDPSIGRWDTSNVEAMVATFLNAGYYPHVGFDQDISRWNTSNVKTMEAMFMGAVMFNQNIRCWDMSNVEDITYMFTYTMKFNQNLSNWILRDDVKHDCVFRFENGHNGDISLKNYCELRSRVNNENIGRDGVRGDPLGDCPYLPKGKYWTSSDPYTSTCCGQSDTYTGSKDPDVPAGYGTYTSKTLCWPYFTYADACDGKKVGGKTYTWKDIVHACIDKYLGKHYPGITEDEVNCSLLRVCRECHYHCNKCRADHPDDIEGQKQCFKDLLPVNKEWVCDCDEVTAEPLEPLPK